MNAGSLIMPSILLGTDLKRDLFIDDILAKNIRNIGYNFQVIYPLLRLPDTLRIISATSGQIHAIIIVHTGAMTSGITNPWDVADKIRNLDDKYSIDSVVKAKSLPILIVEDKTVAYSEDMNRFNIRWCSYHDPFYDLTTFTDVFFNLLHDWRKDLLQELECVGYAVSIDKFGKLTVDPVFVRSNVEGRILAPKATLGRLRSSRYLILSSDLISDANPYIELSNLLNDYRDLAKKRRTKPEEIFQDFFERNPSMIKRNLFCKHWARPRLRFPEKPTKYIEPDFVLKPRFAANIGTKWQILDIKLPDVALTSGGRFHQGFSAKLLRAIKQVRDYRKYFNRDEIENELVQKFGYHPKNPRLAILIGITPQSDKVKAMEELQGDYNMLDIDIITYDEILESRSKLLETHFRWLESIK